MKTSSTIIDLLGLSLKVFRACFQRFITFETIPLGQNFSSESNSAGSGSDSRKSKKQKAEAVL